MFGTQNGCLRRFRFFRILAPGFTSKLALPQGFIKYFIEANTSWAMILSPLGKIWHVKIDGDSQNLHFIEGWGGFAAAHKLSVGDFLVFKHKGSLFFDVTIFDQSTCERDYDVRNGVAGDRSPVQVQNSATQSESSRGQATSLGRTAAEMDQGTHKNPSGTDEQDLHRPPETANRCVKGASFEVKIKPDHKYSGIPANFIEPNNLSSTTRELFLIDPKDHMWPAELVWVTRKRSYIMGGWQEFYVGNNLEDGDVCVFEQINEKNEVHVQIRRRRDVSPMKTSTGEKDRRTKRLLREKATVEMVKETVDQKGSPSRDTSASDPCFMSTIRPSNLRSGYVNIPFTFQSSVDFSRMHEVVLLDPHFRRWVVKVHHQRRENNEKFRISRGWRDFQKVNNLEVGDVCVFSLKSGTKKVTFQVEVIKYSVTTGER